MEVFFFLLDDTETRRQSVLGRTKPGLDCSIKDIREQICPLETEINVSYLAWRLERRHAWQEMLTWPKVGGMNYH